MLMAAKAARTRRRRQLGAGRSGCGRPLGGPGGPWCPSSSAAVRSSVATRAMTLEPVKGGDVGELAVSGDVAQQPPRRRAHIGYERATCGISVHADDVAGPFRTLPDLA